jgi:hypothetical protein
MQRGEKLHAEGKNAGQPGTALPLLLHFLKALKLQNAVLLSGT